MNEALISNWNSVVTAKDTVYHLGDFCFGNDEYDVEKFISRLNGRIHFIHGNHDKPMYRFFKSKLYKDKYYHKVLDLGYYSEVKHEEQKIVLMHYAMRIWNKSHYGTWQLYGHSHGTLPDDPHSLSFDAGVDCHNYIPISFNQVKNIMSKKFYKPIDHHKSGENIVDKVSPNEYAKRVRYERYLSLKREFE